MTHLNKIIGEESHLPTDLPQPPARVFEVVVEDADDIADVQLQLVGELGLIRVLDPDREHWEVRNVMMEWFFFISINKLLQTEWIE